MLAAAAVAVRMNRRRVVEIEGLPILDATLRGACAGMSFSSESRQSVEWRRGSALNLIDVQREHEFPAFEPLGFARLWQLTKERLRLWPFRH